MTPTVGLEHLAELLTTARTHALAATNGIARDCWRLRLVSYETGTSLSKTILENDSKQAFYLMQEAIDGQALYLTQDSLDLQWNANSKRIKNGATPTATTDLTTKAYVDTAISTQVTAIGAGNVVGPSSSVSGNIVTWNGTTGTVIADSGTGLGDIITGTGTLTTNNLIKVNANRVVQDAGVAAGNVVTATTAALATNQLALSDTTSKSIKYLPNGSNGQALTMVAGAPAWGSPSSSMVWLATSAATATVVDFAVISSAYVAYHIIGRDIAITTPTITLSMRTASADIGTFTGSYYNNSAGASSSAAINGVHLETFAGIAGNMSFDHTLIGVNGASWSYRGFTVYGSSIMKLSGSHTTANVSGVTTIRFTFSIAPTAGTIHIYGVKSS